MAWIQTKLKVRVNRFHYLGVILNSNINQYDVAIVGFGLIGQICAKVCSQYNLRTLVIESKSDTEFSSKAVSFDDESLRLLENVGLYDSLKEFLNKPDFTDIVLTNGKVIQRNPVLPVSYTHLTLPTKRIV